MPVVEWATVSGWTNGWKGVNSLWAGARCTCERWADALHAQALIDTVDVQWLRNSTGAKGYYLG